MFLSKLIQSFKKSEPEVLPQRPSPATVKVIKKGLSFHHMPYKPHKWTLMALILLAMLFGACNTDHSIIGPDGPTKLEKKTALNGKEIRAQ